MRASARSTSPSAKAPGVLAVLTGADWQASGFGDLPVPGGCKRRDGEPCSGRPIRRWSRTACAGSATTSPSWWPRRYLQALDAAELIEVDYEPLPAVVSTPRRAPGAPRVWDDCDDNICFVQIVGDKAATEAAFARADHVVKHRFVINRVTAATMEPRGSIGDYNAADGRYTIYTTLQRAHAFAGAGADRAQGAGEQGARGRRRYRRQLRHEIGGLQRGRAGAAGRRS